MRQDNCHLVRTRSLGSVGAQTVENIRPSDDNSSCGSETQSYGDFNTITRKQRQKEWCETSLDDPVSSTPKISRSNSTLPSISPDVNYVDPSLISVPQISKPILEIPAESYPSLCQPEPNIKLFNNSIPKNCTIVQRAKWKPYREETKPFEMSDFYKYSTKFNKVTSMLNDERDKRSVKYQQLRSPQINSEICVDDVFQDDGSIIQKGIYQPLQPMKCQPLSSTK